MRTPTIKQKPRKAAVDSFPAPTGGLVSNRNLSISRGPNDPPAAAVMNDVFPTATGVIVRRGTSRWASVTAAMPVKSMFTYVSGMVSEMFAANDLGIRNVSTGATPGTFIGPDVLTGKSGGDWNVVQFSTAGGAFLIGVNGVDVAFQYDGAAFSAPAITFPAPYAAKTTADLSYVWVYKQRIWFIEKNSLNAWYLPVDQIGGALTLWPMGGIFVLGGTLQWGQAWSLDSGGAGGLSEQCVFTTTEGEVAAYQGLSPDVDQGWTKAGLYRIGKPLGPKAFMRAGGDLVIGTTVGFISLASASRLDYAALGKNAVSYPIEDDWAQAVAERGGDNWRIKVWADGQMALICAPQLEGANPEIFVINVNTGTWCKFRGWDVSSITAFDGKLFFGTSTGTVLRGWSTGADEGVPYSWQCLPLFSDLGQPASQKTLKTARAITRSPYGSKVQVSGHVNFKAKFPATPSIQTETGANIWDVGVWDVALWGGRDALLTVGDWVSIGGAGHDVSVGVQGSSGLPTPIDIELIRIDLTYQAGEIGS